MDVREAIELEAKIIELETELEKARLALESWFIANQNDEQDADRQARIARRSPPVSTRFGGEDA